MDFNNKLNMFNCIYLTFSLDTEYSIQSVNKNFENFIKIGNSLKSILRPSSFLELTTYLKNKTETFQCTLAFVLNKKLKFYSCNFSFQSDNFQNSNNEKTIVEVFGFDITKLKKENISLNYEKDILNIALKNASTEVWKYDLKTKTVHIISTDTKNQYHIEKIENFPESFIENEYIHPDSLFPFLELHEALKRGEPSCEAEIRVKKNKTEYRWVKMKYVMIYDSETGSPIDAIGTGKDITAAKEIQLRTLLDMQYKEAMISDALCLVEVNLSKNLILSSDSRLKDVLKSNMSMSVSGLAKAICNQYIIEDEKALFLNDVSTINLIEQFRKGKSKVFYEYKVGITKDLFYWIRLYINFILEPLQGDICALIYVKNITDKKLREQKLQSKAEKDSLSGLYNRATTEFKVNSELKNRREDCLSVLYMIDLDNFKQINDVYGHLAGDTVICEISNRLKKIFRDSDIISRLGGDEFSVFLSNVPSVEFIKTKAKQICETVSTPIFLDNISKSVSCSVGISIAPQNGKKFNELYNNADKALYNSKSGGKNQYHFFNDEE